LNFNLKFVALEFDSIAMHSCQLGLELCTRLRTPLLHLSIENRPPFLSTIHEGNGILKG